MQNQISNHIHNLQNERKNQILKGFGITDLEKGEGDRGGKIVGHTKSGKAIYEASEKDVSSGENFKANLKKHNINHYEDVRGNIHVYKNDYNKVLEGGPKPGAIYKKGKDYSTTDGHTHGTGFAIKSSDSLDKVKEEDNKFLEKRNKEKEKSKANFKHIHEHVKKITGDDTLEHDGYDANDRPLFISKKKGQEDIEHTVSKSNTVYRHDGVTSKKIGKIPKREE